MRYSKTWGICNRWEKPLILIWQYQDDMIMRKYWTAESKMDIGVKTGG